jgi:DNA repair protein RadC
VADLQPARALLQDGLASLLRRVAAGASDIKRPDATRLAAAFELARRAIAPLPEPLEAFHPNVIGPRLATRYALNTQEHLGALFLDTRGRIITEREVFVGTLHSAIVSTRDVLQLSLGLHAKAVVVFHNHPSGDPEPSEPDVVYTQRLAQAAQLLDIDLVDHLVLGHRRYTSMKARGYF